MSSPLPSDDSPLRCDRPTLTVFTPGEGVSEFFLSKPEVSFGRSLDCDIQFPLPWLSRKQLVFSQSENHQHWTLQSVGRNAATVAGKQLKTQHHLTPGDRIKVGPMLIVFDVEKSRPEEWDHSEIQNISLVLSMADIQKREVNRAYTAHRQLLQLAEASVATANLYSHKEAAEAILKTAAEVLQPLAVSIVELSAANKATVLGSHGLQHHRLHKKIVFHSVAHQSTVVVEDVNTRKTYGGIQSGNNTVGPILCASLGTEIRGVLYADRSLGEHAFSEADAAFATVLAQLAGTAIAAARRHQSLRSEKEQLRRDLDKSESCVKFVGTSPPTRALQKSIGKVAPTQVTVLIGGETGSGKEVVAKEIYRKSRRASKPFFALNCAALPDQLLESELFGHKRGAFTGAVRDRQGIFELADQGTIFLDEIAELSASAQAKVLRVLDQREVTPVGADTPLSVDVRLIAATHRDLAKEVAEGRFREDLYYRLNVFPVDVPPLRDRLEDLPELVAHLFARSETAQSLSLRPPSEEVMKALAQYQFPGNVRELRHLLERAAVMTEYGNAISIENFPEELVRVGTPKAVAPEEAPPESLRSAVASYEATLIRRELDRYHWNRSATAKHLKLSRRAFMDKLSRYSIKAPITED